MKRKIYKWKTEIIWFLLVILFALALAFWGVRSVPAIMQAGLYMPEALYELNDKVGGWLSPTGNVDGSLNPAPVIKFMEMLLMQILWFIFVSWSFRSYKQGKKGTIVGRILLPAAGAFGYGMLMTVVWFWTGNRMSQLIPGFVFYVGGFFCIWFICMLLLGFLAEITIKNTTLSVGTQILQMISRIYAFLISPLWYYWFYAEGFSYDAYWVPFMVKHIVVLMSLIKYFLLYAVVIAVLGAVFIVGLSYLLLPSEKEDEQNVNTAEECRRLIVYAAPSEILYGGNLSIQWLCFLMDNGNTTARARHMAAFMQGENLVSSLQQYVTRKVDAEKFEEKIFLCWEEEGSQLTFTKTQKEKINYFLKEMETAGFKVIVNQHVWSMQKGMEELVPERILYNEYPVRISNANHIPMELIREYDVQKNVRNVYLEIQEFLASKEMDPFLQDCGKRLCFGEGTVAQFYNLLKMAEYCIHRRALYALSKKESVQKYTEEQLRSVSFGTWREFQNMPELVLEDPVLAEQVRTLDKLAARDDKSNIKMKKVPYDEITRVMVNLRNRFVGHGTMIYSINGEFLYPMANAVLQILRVYEEQRCELNENILLLSGRTEYPVKGIWKKEGLTYLFNGIDVMGYRDYLNYDTGAFLTVEPDGSREIVKAPVLNCKKPDAVYQIMEKAYKEVSEEQKAAKEKFIQKYKKASLWDVRGNSEAFAGIETDLQTKFLTKEIYQEQFNMSEFHEDLLRMDIDKVLHLWDSEGWDCMGDAWKDPMPVDEAYLFSMLLDGEFLPKAPIRIGVLGESKYPFSNKYAWIRSLEMKTFETYPAIISWAGNAPVSKSRLNKMDKRRLKDQSGFAESDVTYQRVLSELGCPSLLQSENIYMAGFFKNIFDYEDASTSTMALFDFIEFMMQSVQYTLMELNHISVAKNVVNPDLQKTGKLIMKYAQDGS